MQSNDTLTDNAIDGNFNIPDLDNFQINELLFHNVAVIRKFVLTRKVSIEKFP